MVESHCIEVEGQKIGVRTGLAFIGRVVYLMAIPKADNVLLASVNINRAVNWKGIVRKNELHIGDRCVVFLPDSVLPEEEIYEFMKKYDYRVRMQRYRGERSECLIMPMWFDDGGIIEVGDDVTELLEVKKYEKPMPKVLCGNMLRRMPSFIPRTDEINYQQMKDLSVFDKYGRSYYITEKLDGTSSTAYRWSGHFGVCSRNVESSSQLHCNGHAHFASQEQQDTSCTTASTVFREPPSAP